MNSKIEKLIDDAKLTAVLEMFEGELINFAELIVQECIVQAQSVDQLRGATEDMIHGADIAGLQIARHFGIKL